MKRFLHGSIFKAVAISGLLMSLCACTTTEIDEFRQGETGIADHESIVILGRRQNNNYETEGSFVQCVANVVSSGSRPINVVGEQEFLDAMFPFSNRERRRCAQAICGS